MLDFLDDILSSDSGKQGREGGIEVNLEGFEDWFRGEIEDQTRFHSTEEIKRDLEENVEKLGESLEKVRNAEVDEEMASRLESAGRSNKDVLVNRLQNFIGNFSTSETSNFLDLVRFMEEKSSELAELEEKLQKNIMFVQKLHESETRKLVDSLHDLEENLDLAKEIEERKNIREEYSEVEEILDEVEEIEDEIENMEEQLSKKEDEIRELEDKLESVQEKEPSEEIEEKENLIEKLEMDEKKMKNRIVQNISPLKRSLKKYRYHASVPGGNEDLLEKYIENPIQGAMDDDGLSFLKKVKDNLDELLETDDLGFGEDEAEKARRDLEQLDLEGLKKWKDEIDEIRDEIKDTKEGIGNLKSDEEINRIQRKTENTRKDLESLNKKIDRKIDRKEGLTDSLKERKEKLEEDVNRLLNTDLKINLE